MVWSLPENTRKSCMRVEICVGTMESSDSTPCRRQGKKQPGMVSLPRFLSVFTAYFILHWPYTLILSSFPCYTTKNNLKNKTTKPTCCRCLAYIFNKCCCLEKWKKERREGERKKRRKGGRKRGKGRSKEKRKGKTEGGTREEKIIINSIFYMFHVKKITTFTF